MYVMPLIEFSVLAGARVIEPLAVGLIPVDRSADSFLKADLGLPTQFPADLGAVQSISAIMSRAILHKSHKRFRLSEVMHY